MATTFTLDTALFEEECLARFAGVQSDPNRDGALYRIEREEKLAALLCAAVVADIHHCAGRRSLRWDLLASRPESGVMHAKIGLLAWQRHVRAIVASARASSATRVTSADWISRVSTFTQRRSTSMESPWVDEYRMSRMGSMVA